MTNSIMWFRRDLRLADNHALTDAIADARRSGGAVIALFVVDDALWESSGANRRWFLSGCLRELDTALDGQLVVRHGEPVDVITELVERHDVRRVFRAQDVGVYGRRRDDAVAEALGATGRELVEADSPWAVPPGTVHTADGGTFKVYSAYLRAWRQQRLAAQVARPSDVPTVERVRSDGVPAVPRPSADLPEPGEAAGHRALDRFVASRLDDYASTRDDPGADATSRLSAYLRFGSVHPRQLLRRLDGRRPSHDTFAKELAWRDFYADVLDAWPGSAWRPWNQRMAGIEVDGGERAETRFTAWCDGRTGYPIVDAGMRQLVAEGWMHNRVRMITASFLVKDLHVDWTWGARFFMEHLVDGDVPSNNHGWQWVAGTGTDASPYHRIFNPSRQAEKFDAGGVYIRRWVAELADVDDRYVHEPWTAPEGPPHGYPVPIVDHAVERDEALARYNALRR
ncbi:MAG: deoxyribodipyrimidine photo-lyase [Ilumatobacteraceae bacterium]